MEAESLSRAFAELSTPLIADAALRLKIPLRISPPGIRPVTPNQRFALTDRPASTACSLMHHKPLMMDGWKALIAKLNIAAKSPVPKYLNKL
jgi:hypothetical protein